jgi:hypothetical protein
VRPRFVVSRLSRSGATNAYERTAASVYYVYDRAYCFAIVGEFPTDGPIRRVGARERALELAARLNALHGPFPVSR